jgi:hypothetical protein
MKYPGLVLCLMVVGCNQAPAPTQSEPPKYYKVDPATAGKLRGKVLFAGKKPAARTISMNAEEACEKQHPKGVTESPVVTGPGGALANVVVYIKTGLEGKTFEPPKQAVVLDQRGCQFIPRVVALQTGQTLAVKNSDPVSHNIHPRPEKNREWNQQQPPGSADLQRRFALPEMMIPVKCNIHSWMRSYIAVLDDPYFAVTTNAGTFEFDAVPPGDYTVGAWHENLGELAQAVQLKPRSQGVADFTFHSTGSTK